MMPAAPRAEMPTLDEVTDVMLLLTAVMFSACVFAIVAPSAT